MKTLQITAPGEFEILEVPTPRPAPSQVLVRVEAVTTCPQWDLHLRHNEPMFPGHNLKFPYSPGQPGHEAVGVVESVGVEVPQVLEGQRVCIWRDPGHDKAGCYAQFVLRDAADVIRVPDDLPPESLAPLELAMCVGASFLQLKRTGDLNGRFGISGLGPSGLIAAQMARAEGATQVVGFDLSPPRREHAIGLWHRGRGSRPARGQRRSASRSPRQNRTGMGRGLCGCQSERRVSDGSCVAGGDDFRRAAREIAFAPRHWAGGLLLCGYPGHSREAAEYALSLIEAEKLNLAPLVTHHLPLERYNEGIDLWRGRKRSRCASGLGKAVGESQVTGKGSSRSSLHSDPASDSLPCTPRDRAVTAQRFTMHGTHQLQAARALREGNLPVVSPEQGRLRDRRQAPHLPGCPGKYLQLVGHAVDSGRFRALLSDSV
jgi:threonine dehydrogenase-like Zn-dependent dehydrogenase